VIHSFIAYRFKKLLWTLGLALLLEGVKTSPGQLDCPSG